MKDVPASNKPDQAAPKPAKKVAVVQCKDFRCLAYFEPDTQIWRDVQTGMELPGVQSIVFEFAV